jgi:broad specificity phosphatase PhoE
MDFPSVCFYLIRHPETEANANGMFAGGAVDTPFSAEGAGRQMEELLKTVQALPQKPARIFHTGLQRTRIPAERIAQLLDLPAPQEAPELKERDWGSLAGRPKKPSPLLDDDTPKPGVAAHGLERKARFLARSNAALAALLRAETDGTKLIVAHRGTVEALCAAFGKYPALKPRNAGVYRFSITPNPARPEERVLTGEEFYLDSHGKPAQRTVRLTDMLSQELQK